MEKKTGQSPPDQASLFPESIAGELTLVIPAYRCAKFLPATVASALRCGDAPIVIQEDCSGDQTLEVARQCQSLAPARISVIANPRNLGMTANWQAAIEQVQTPFVLKLDGDDLISPAYVGCALSFLRRTPEVAIIGAGLVNVDADFGLDGTVPPDFPIEADDFIRYSGTDAARFLIRWRPYPASATTLYRMSVWREVGGFDLALNWCPDREIWFRMARRNEMAYCNGPGLYRRIHSSNITNQYQDDLGWYERSHLFRQVKLGWPERDLAALLRRTQLRLARKFLGSACRAARRGRYRDILPRFAKSIEELAWVLSH